MKDQHMNFESYLESTDIPYKMKIKLQSIPKDQKEHLASQKSRIEIAQDFSQYGNTDAEIMDNLMSYLEENAQLEHIHAVYEWLAQNSDRSSELLDSDLEMNLRYVLSSLMQYTQSQICKQESVKRLYLLHILRFILNNYKITPGLLDVIRDHSVVPILLKQIDVDQVEISSLALRVTTIILQSSTEGQALVMESIEKRKSELKKENRLSFFAELLHSTKSSVLCLNICLFLSSLCVASQVQSILADMNTSRVFEILERIQQSLSPMTISGGRTASTAASSTMQSSVKKPAEKEQKKESINHDIAVAMNEHQNQVKYQEVLEQSECVEMTNGSQIAEEGQVNGPDSNQQLRTFERKNEMFGFSKQEEKSQLWKIQQENQQLKKEIEKLNDQLNRAKMQPSTNAQTISDRQSLMQTKQENKLVLEEKEKSIAKLTADVQMFQRKIADLTKDKSELSAQLNQSTIDAAASAAASTLAKETAADAAGRIQHYQEQLASMQKEYAQFKASKDKEITSLQTLLNSAKSNDASLSELKAENKELNSKVAQLEAILDQSDGGVINNNSSFMRASVDPNTLGSIIKITESQAQQEITQLKNANKAQAEKLALVMEQLAASKNTVEALEKKISQQQQQQQQNVAAANVPQAPVISGIPQAPVISGIPQAPVISGIPQAPAIANVIPQAPNILGVNNNKQSNTIPSAPVIPGFTVPNAPVLPGIPNAPTGLPGIPQAPVLKSNGVPNAPVLPGISVPTAPVLPGISVPTAPVLPGIGVPSAPMLPGFGVPSAPALPGIGVPSAPSLPGFGIPSAPNLPNIGGIPSAPPSLPGMSKIISSPAIVLKAKKNPGVAMKGVNWQILKKTDIVGTLWEKIDDERIEIEEDFLRQEFSQKVIAAKNPMNSLALSSQDAQQKKVQITSMERQQNVLLILGKIKLKGDKIASLLIQCDSPLLTPSLVSSLLASLPTEQEMSQIQSLEADTLADAEKYFKCLEKVEGYEERLRGLQFKSSFDELEHFVVDKIKVISEFLENVQNDDAIHLLLEHALAVGNYQNGQGFKGGAYGFKFSNIDKLVEVKSHDGKTNLLMYIIQRAEKLEDRELIKIDEDTKQLEECTKTPIGQLISEVSEMKKGIKAIEKAIAVQTSNPNDKIKDVLEPFLQEAQPIVQTLDTNVRALENSYKAIAESFAEDPRKVQSDEFARAVLSFKKVCVNAKQQSIKMAALAAKTPTQRMSNPIPNERFSHH